MKQLFFLLPMIFFLGCSSEEELKTESKTNTLYSDSSLTKIDSLILTDIKLPEVINYLQFDTATIVVFQTLAQETKGKMYLAANANRVVETVIQVIENHGGDNIDLCFLIDKTGSMMDDVMLMQSSMERIFSAIRAYKNINVALAYYGDRNVDGKSWIDINDFSQDFEKLEKDFKRVYYSGGGDTPESVTDAAYEVINKLNWTSTSKRLILVLGDAPSLVPPLAKYSVEDVIREAKSKDILMNYYPIVVGFAGTQAGPQNENLIASVYPNPSSGLINLLLEKEQEYTINVFNSSGVLVYEQVVNDKKLQIDLSGNNEDLYIIRVLTTNNSLMDQQKILIRK